jgi:hypothetical protein
MGFTNRYQCIFCENLVEDTNKTNHKCKGASQDDQNTNRINAKKEKA